MSTKKRSLYVVLTPLLFVLFFIVFSNVTLARESGEQSRETTTTEKHSETDDSSNDKNTSDDSSRQSSRAEELKTQRTERKEVAKERLSEAKLKLCQVREQKVDNIMKRVVERGQRHIDRISTIADRAQAFYDKQGNQLDIYETLVENVEAAKVAAQNTIMSLSTNATFSCESDAPKAAIENFHVQHQLKIDAVSVYRDAVKALIKGIKSVQPQDSDTEPQS